MCIRDSLIAMPDFSDVQDDAIYDVTFSAPDKTEMRYALGIKHWMTMRWILNNSTIARLMFRNLAETRYARRIYYSANRIITTWQSEAANDEFSKSKSNATDNAIISSNGFTKRNKKQFCIICDVS